MPIANPDRPADRIALFLNALVRAVADTFPKGQQGPKAQQGQLLLWQRLMHLGARFTAILAAARRPPSQKPRSRSQATSRNDAPPKPPPENFGLLFSQLPGYERYRSEFETMLQQPDIAELLKSTPQLRRVLNPLCRMLNLKPLPAPTPAPQTPSTEPPSTEPASTEPANSSAYRQSQARRQLTPGLLASPARTRKAPPPCGPPPPSLWSCILRELDRRKNRATKAAPAQTG